MTWNLETMRLDGDDRPPDLDFWTARLEKASALAKRGHLENANFKLPVQPRFKPLTGLLKNLHGFFHRRIWEDIDEADLDPHEDHVEFLGYFSQAIQDVERFLDITQCIPQKRAMDEQGGRTVAKKERI